MSKPDHNKRTQSELPDTTTPRGSVPKTVAEYEQKEPTRTIAAGVGAQGRSNTSLARPTPEEINSVRQGEREDLGYLQANPLPEPTVTPPVINKRRISQLPDATTPEQRAAVEKMIADWEARQCARHDSANKQQTRGSDVQLGS